MYPAGVVSCPTGGVLIFVLHSTLQLLLVSLYLVSASLDRRMRSSPLRGSVIGPGWRSPFDHSDLWSPTHMCPVIGPCSGVQSARLPPSGSGAAEERRTTSLKYRQRCGVWTMLALLVGTVTGHILPQASKMMNTASSGDGAADMAAGSWWIQKKTVDPMERFFI